MVGTGVALPLFPFPDTFPSAPSSPLPQQLIVWSERRAQLCAEPELTAVALLISLTGTGARLLGTVSPFPSSPKTPEPQHKTRWLERTAQVLEPPAAIAVAF